MPRLPRRSGAASRASRRRLNQSKRATQCHLPTPATQNDGRCEVVPCLPREIKVDVTKCHACHAEVARRHVCVCVACVCVCVCVCLLYVCVCDADDGRCEVVPRLPHEIKVDVTKCHACHAEVARRHGRHGGA